MIFFQLILHKAFLERWYEKYFSWYYISIFFTVWTKLGFFEIAGFPGILGCINCTHIPIIAALLECVPCSGAKACVSWWSRWVCQLKDTYVGLAEGNATRPKFTQLGGWGTRKGYHTEGYLCYTRAKVAQITIGCFVLHNIFRRNGNPVPSGMGLIAPSVDTAEIFDETSTLTGEQTRNNIVNYFL